MDSTITRVQGNWMKKILVTGSCGFIFSNFMNKVIKEFSNYKFVSVDKVLASYNIRNIPRDHRFYMGDVADIQFMDNVFCIEKPDIVIHGAAESFVDDAIRSASPFVHSNIVGTQVMVDLAVKYGVERFVYISTDEVYGQLQAGEPSWTEESYTKPRNPYSATKLAGELIVHAASQTHGLQYNITRCCNNYGPNQPPRNLVPKIITSIINKTPIPIHGTGKQFREWLYVEDNCSAIMTILENAPTNEVYNIGSGIEQRNLDMVQRIGSILNVKEPLSNVNFIKDRAGHDFRYSVNCTKIKKLGWKPQYSFDHGLQQSVYWYVNNHKYYE